MQAAAATWQFSPFVARGKPVRVCAIVPFSEPSATNQQARGRSSALYESNPEVSYRALKKSKEVFSFAIQDVNGERWKYLGCRVAKVARKDDSQGNRRRPATRQ